jgi:hypothetical protein
MAQGLRSSMLGLPFALSGRIGPSTPGSMDMPGEVLGRPIESVRIENKNNNERKNHP